MDSRPKPDAAWVDYGFGTGELDEIVSIYQPENRASGAVMRKLGFSFERATAHPVLGVEVHVLRLRRSEWRVPAVE